MTDQDISDCLDALTEEPNVKSLREDLDAHYLYNDILGFQEVEKEDEELK